jgi:hypothetical protein
MKGKILGKLKGTKMKTILGGLKKSTPEMLIAAGIIAMGAAVVLGIKNAPKAQKEVNKKKKMYKAKGEEMPKDEEILTHAKHQAGTAVLFVTGAVAVVGANHIQHRRNIALALALEAAEASAGDLEGKLNRLLGKERAEKVNEEREARKTETDGKSDREIRYVKTGPSDIVRFQDKFTGLSFYSTYMDMEQALKDVNYKLINLNSSVALSTFYEILNVFEGLTEANESLGWDPRYAEAELPLDIEYGDDNIDGVPVRTFEFTVKPTHGFLD